MPRMRSVILIFLFAACSENLVDDPIPFVAFPEEVITLSLVPALQQDGGHYLVNGKGVRGIIVHRVNSTTFRAFERNCSFQPNEACATVDVHTTGLFMLDACCGSNFDFPNGNPTGGPAFRPLRQYRTQLSGSTLTVTDEVIN